MIGLAKASAPDASRLPIDIESAEFEQYGLETVQPCKRLGRLGANGDKAAVKVRHLLFVHELSASVNDIVLGFESIDRTFGCESLLLQFLEALLQPGRSCAIGVEFGVELVSDIRVGNCVCDLRSSLCIAGVKTESRSYIAKTNPNGGQPIIKFGHKAVHWTIWPPT